MKKIIFYIAFFVPFLSIAQIDDAFTKEQLDKQEQQQADAAIKQLDESGKLFDEFDAALECYMEQKEKCTYKVNEQWKNSRYFDYFKSLTYEKQVEELDRIMGMHINFVDSIVKQSNSKAFDKVKDAVKKHKDKLILRKDNNKTKKQK